MSKRFLKSALYSVNQLFSKQEDLSFKSKHDYAQDARLILRQLHEAGFQLSSIHHLKSRHIEHLVKRWQEEQLNPATIKNRVSRLRYVAKAINKSTIVASNNELALKPRSYLPSYNKAITDIDLNRFTNPLIRDSVRLQQLFGLRREESIKFIVSEADKGTHIALKGSWTKGGIPRMIPVTNQEQRQFLNELKQRIPKNQALIPKDYTYRQQEITYISQVKKAGYKNLHGLRHAYAQERYRQLTRILSKSVGWECPRCGGPTRKEMTAIQVKIDYSVRHLISECLGHSRQNIIKIYSG